MKRSLVLLLLLPLLGSCSVQEDYYGNDNYYSSPQSMARVNGPYNSFNHFTRRQRSVVPRNYHSHRNASVATTDRFHGHQGASNTTIHRHDDNQDNRNHGHPDEWNNRSHGHD